MILADKIITLRKKQGWSQEQLANELGVSRQAVSKWESAMSIPDLDKIVTLSGLFGVSTDYLLKDTIEKETPSETAAIDDVPCRIVNAEEAHLFMDTVAGIAKVMAGAISLLVLSPIPLLLLGGLSEYRGFLSEDLAAGLGVAVLLLMVAVGVILLILNGMKLSKYEYLEKDPISLSYGVEGIITKRQIEFAPRFRTAIALGVGLCILGIIPLFLVGGLGLGDFVCVCMVCVLLVCVSIAVFFFVSTGMIHESYEKLLQKGEYTPVEKESQRKTETFSAVYWCLATAIYLAISFYFGNWHRSWTLWPVAGVLYGAVLTVAKAVVRRK